MSHAPVPTEPVPNPEDPGTLVPVRSPGEGDTFFTRPANVRRIVVGLYLVAVLLVLLDLLYAKHGHFAIEDWFGFYGFYGFVGCVTLVLLAKVLRRLVMRPEDYYDR
jgi:hypothetical protein